MDIWDIIKSIFLNHEENTVLCLEYEHPEDLRKRCYSGFKEQRK